MTRGKAKAGGLKKTVIKIKLHVANRGEDL